MNQHPPLSSVKVAPLSAGVKEPQAVAINPAIIGERVRIARMAANLTQQELAGNTYSKSYISAVERGKMTPSFQALRLLAERLGRSISYFLGEGDLDLQALVGSGTSALALSDEERRQREQEARQMLIEAEAWLVKGQAEQALAALQVTANAPPAALPLLEQPRWYWLAGWAGVWAKQYPEVIGWLERGLELTEAAQAQAPTMQKARLGEMAERIRMFLGVCYYDQGHPAKALAYHLRCLAAMTNGTVTDPELKLAIYKALGNDTSLLGRQDEAIDFYQRACKLAEDMNDPRQRGLAYWGLGLTYKASGDFVRAETAFRHAVDIFERLDNMQFSSQLHAVLGQVLTERDAYEQAERHLRLALHGAERINDEYARGIALGNLAILHLKQGNLDEAITAAQAGASALRQGNSSQTEGQVYQTLAEAYEAKGDAATAEQAYKESIATLMQTEDRVFICRVRERYGQFLANQGRFEDAYEQMDQAQNDSGSPGANH
jgi:tetratricopeptide (TPR) repeat protein